MKSIILLILTVAPVLRARVLSGAYFSDSDEEYTTNSTLFFRSRGDRAGITIPLYPASFGSVRYGSEMHTKLMVVQPGYMPPDFDDMDCGRCACRLGCVPYDKIKPKVTPDDVLALSLSSVTLIISGDWSDEVDDSCGALESRALYAQQLGAKALVIVRDPVYPTPRPPSMYSGSLTREKMDEIGESVLIPVFYVRKQNIQPVMEALKWQDGKKPYQHATIDMKHLADGESHMVYTQVFYSAYDQGYSAEAFTTFLLRTADWFRAAQAAKFNWLRPNLVLDYNGCLDSAPSNYCDKRCIRGNRYCASEMNVVDEDYKPRDIVIMGLIQLCVYDSFLNTEERDGSVAWLNYTATARQECTIAQRTFDSACHIGVFDRVLPDRDVKQKWMDCWDAEPDLDEPLQILEDNYVLAAGGMPGTADAGDQIVDVDSNPCFRINNEILRGSYQGDNVPIAICAQLKDEMVRDEQCAHLGRDTCSKWSCQTQEHIAANKTKCQETFHGYSCECADGFEATAVPDAQFDDSYEMCSDINECLLPENTLNRLHPNCGCERCGCMHGAGSFQCTGALPDDQCAIDDGGCWTGENDLGEAVSACVNNVESFLEAAKLGIASAIPQFEGARYPWVTCTCPLCFKEIREKRNGPPMCIPACSTDECGSNGCVGLSKLTAQELSREKELVEAVEEEMGSGMSPAKIVVLVLGLFFSCVLILVAVVYASCRSRAAKRKMHGILNEYLNVPDEGDGHTDSQTADTSVQMTPMGVGSA